MYVEDLVIKVTEGNASVTTVKDLISEISVCKPTAESLQKLHDVAFVPIRQPGGTVFLVHPTSDFAIIDHEGYAQMFADRVPVLDCDMHEAHILKPFIDAMGWHDRHMSTSVEEKSMVGEGFLSREMTMDLRRRAFALFRSAREYSHRANH